MVHKNEMLFFKASCTLCNLKTHKQYDTKRELYSHKFIYVTQALLNKVANEANETKLCTRWNLNVSVSYPFT